MTIDTTFKEFVHENGTNFCLLDFGSWKYRTLVEAFNKAKSQLGAEEEAREHQRIRAWLVLSEQAAIESLRRRRAQRPRRGARFARSQLEPIAA
jgi:hypothetical protein